MVRSEYPPEVAPCLEHFDLLQSRFQPSLSLLEVGLLVFVWAHSAAPTRRGIWPPRSRPFLAFRTYPIRIRAIQTTACRHAGRFAKATPETPESQWFFLNLSWIAPNL